jgi:hypothetical protein
MQYLAPVTCTPKEAFSK